MVQEIFFGKPPGTPFDMPGTYYIPEEKGFKSIGGGKYAPSSGGYKITKEPKQISKEEIILEEEPTPSIQPTPTSSAQPKRISPGDYKGASYEQQAQIGMEAGRLTKGFTESEASFKYRLASLGRGQIARGDPRAMGVTLTAVPFGKEFVGPMPSPTKMIKGSVISSFKPFRIPPSEELGVKVGAFESLWKEAGKEFRTLFNIRTGEDLTSDLGASAVLRDISGTKIKSPEELYGFGTEIKYQKEMYRPDLTIGEISKQDWKFRQTSRICYSRYCKRRNFYGNRKTRKRNRKVAERNIFWRINIRTSRKNAGRI